MNRLKRLFKTAFITDRLKRLYRLSTRYLRVKNAKKKSRVEKVEILLKYREPLRPVPDQGPKGTSTGTTQKLLISNQI